jgi:hypothetical protein
MTFQYKPMFHASCAHQGLKIYDNRYKLLDQRPSSDLPMIAFDAG